MFCSCPVAFDRVLVEQLTAECERLTALFSQAEMALQYTIQERNELQELLILARKLVSHCTMLSS